MPDRPESMLEQVLAHLRDGRFTGVLKVRTPQAEAEVWFLSGIRDEVRFGISTGDEALERLSRATDPQFEAIPRLPGLQGGFKKSLAGSGPLAEARPVDLMRYCERYALTCVLDVSAAGRAARVTYQTGELVSVGGDKQGDVLSEILESSDGTYEITLPPFRLPAGIPLTTSEPGDVQLKAEAEARRKAEAEAEARRKAEAEAEARRKAEAEAEARRKAEAEAEARRKAVAEAEARRKAEAEAEARRKTEAEAEARRKTEAVPKAEKRASRSDSERPSAKSDAKKRRASHAGREPRARAERPKGRKAKARHEVSEGGAAPAAASKSGSGVVWVVVVLLLVAGGYFAWISGIIPR
ncbi:MAG TPA: hypothetical protein VIM73_04890 [Polyangiaceae bacterium]